VARNLRHGAGYITIAVGLIKAAKAGGKANPNWPRHPRRHNENPSVDDHNRSRRPAQEAWASAKVRVDGLLAQVRLRIGDQMLTAVITSDAVRALKLRRGQDALAIIKSTEVMIARSSG
jgi:molybdopterin-binding protein